MTLRAALYQPDIPQNAGSILRTCACLGVAADIIEPAGFPTGARAFRRAGMDYLDYASVTRHRNFESFDNDRRAQGRRLVLLTTSGRSSPAEFVFAADDILLVGRESAGVPDHVHAAADARLRVPMREGLRSLNVAVALGMVLFEALRQTGGFPQ